MQFWEMLLVVSPAILLSEPIPLRAWATWLMAALLVVLLIVLLIVLLVLLPVAVRPGLLLGYRWYAGSSCCLN